MLSSGGRALCCPLGAGLHAALCPSCITGVLLLSCQGAVITPAMEHTMSMQPASLIGPLTQQMNHLSLGTTGTVSITLEKNCMTVRQPVLPHLQMRYLGSSSDSGPHGGTFWGHVDPAAPGRLR